MQNLSSDDKDKTESRAMIAEFLVAFRELKATMPVVNFFSVQPFSHSPSRGLVERLFWMHRRITEEVFGNQ